MSRRVTTACPVYLAALVLLSVTLLSGTAGARMPVPQSDAGSGLPAPTSPGGTPAVGTPAVGAQVSSESVPEDVREARRQLERGDAAVTALALAAKTLLDAGDDATLRLILSGDAEKPLSGLLAALHELPAVNVERLQSEILSVAARGPTEQLRTLALADLVHLASQRPSVVETFIGWLQDPALDAARRVAVIRTLGTARQLVAVEPLIRALDGPQVTEARAALQSLTRRDLGPLAGSREWSAYWEEHRSLPRDVIVELEMDAQREAYERQLRARTSEVIRSRIDRMDADVERLIDGLSNEYPEVRLEAALRLAQHASKEQAATAVPLILRRLGHVAGVDAAGVNGVGASAAGQSAAGADATGDTFASGTPASETPMNGSATGSRDAADRAPGSGGAGAVETDPGVRAQFVTTLGVLGPARDDVRAALLRELESSPYGAVTTAAAAALCSQRGQPSVVVPLLDYLDRTPGEDNAVMVLQALAVNRPTGVIPRIMALAAPTQLPPVRAAAVRALMACENLALALDRLQQLYVGEDCPENVRFAMAVALGDRLRALASEAPERARIVSLLGSLLGDVAPGVRVEAASALGRTGAATALTLLDGRASAESDANVLIAIVQALGALRLPEAGPVIGRIVAQRKTPTPGLEAAAQAALAVLGDQRPPADWLALADSLLRAESPALAAWCYAEMARQFERLPESKDGVDQARAGLARALVAAGQAEAALKLLDQLEATNAPYPAVAERLGLQARALEAVGRDSDAADCYGRLLQALPEGEVGRVAARRSCAAALRKAGRFTEALPLLRTLTRDDVANNALLFELALVEETLGQFAQAQTDLDRLLGRLADTDATLRAEALLALDRVRQAQLGKPAEAAVPPSAEPALLPAAGSPSSPPGASAPEGGAGHP